MPDPLVKQLRPSLARPPRNPGALVPLVLAIATLSVACGHTTHVRPVPEGQTEVEASFGGPVANVGGILFPLPLTTVGASHGLSPHADVGAHLHTTAAAFGVAGLDVGGSWLAVEERGWVPAVSLSGRLYGFTDFRAVRPYLEASAAASYLFKERFLTYAAATTLVQSSLLPLFSLGVGEQLRFGRTGLHLELRWYQPTRVNTFAAVNWQGLGPLGAWGAIVGVSHRFGESKDGESQ